MLTADCWLCWDLLTDDFNLYHETIVTTGTTGTTGTIVTEQTLQTGPAFTAFTACQTATTFTVERKSCHNFTVTFRATFDNISSSSTEIKKFLVVFLQNFYIIENVIFKT